jgi:energy-coupling factor transport system ATP-binding protein
MIRLEHVSYTYPFQSGEAVTDFSLHVRAGEAVLITGASGCGKSTVVRLINGLCPHFFNGRLEGQVDVNGHDNADRRLNEIARDAGTLLQDPEHQFFATTVEDEIAFVHEWRETSADVIRRKVDDVVARFSLGHLLHQSIHALSEGEKQKVALAAVMSTEPCALVLDEPTANLDPESTVHLAGIISELKRAGMAIVIVDHRLYWLESVVDRAVVMDSGRIAAQGDFSILADAGLRERCGLRSSRVSDCRSTLQPPGNTNSAHAGEVQVDGLSFGYVGGHDLFRDVSFSLPRGITALLGSNGAGKTTLARLLTGLCTARQGKCTLGGAEVSPRQLLGRAAIVLQNTDHQLYMKSVREEIEVSARSARKHADRAAVDRCLQNFGLLELAGRHPQSLSGGEKQRLVIACAVIRQPDILILDEPTSGLDGRNMRLIADAMRTSAAHGACVLLISHDLELIGLCCEHGLRIPFETTTTTRR